jgi:copper oxidase (laccase) domain-containing protein
MISVNSKKTVLFLIDLWKANKWLLEQAGVNPNNIQISGICTYTHHEEFYSARYEKDNKCGRNINVIKLKGSCEV